MKKVGKQLDIQRITLHELQIIFENNIINDNYTLISIEFIFEMIINAIYW